MSLITQAKEVKKILITDKKPLFLDTNIYKYYCEYKTLEQSQFIRKFQENPDHATDLKNCEKLFNFIVKHQITIKKNEILEQEISEVILNSKDIKEKIYYQELAKEINFDLEVTSYTSAEETIAKKIAPRTTKKYMEHDFIIIICCNRDNTEIIITKDRGDFKECMKVYSNNKDKLPYQKPTLQLIPLDRFALIIDKIEQEVI